MVASIDWLGCDSLTLQRVTTIYNNIYTTIYSVTAVLGISAAMLKQDYLWTNNKFKLTYWPQHGFLQYLSTDVYHQFDYKIKH